MLRQVNFSILAGAALAAPYYTVTVESCFPLPTTAGTLGEPSHAFRQFHGAASAFPERYDWIRFDLMFPANRFDMAASGDTTAEIALLRENIMRVSAESRLDPRVILAVIMQESTGNVDPPVTYGSNRNTGLMQADNGVVFSSSDPNGTIYTMIKDGVMGTGQSDVCLANYINIRGNIWDALAMYNHGALGVDFQDLSASTGSGTASYVPDVANRLLGWAPGSPSGVAPVSPSQLSPDPAALRVVSGVASDGSSSTAAKSAMSTPALSRPLGKGSTAPAPHSSSQPAMSISVYDHISVEPSQITDVFWAVTNSEYFTNPEWNSKAVVF